MVIFDAATYAAEALAVGLVDPYNAHFAPDRERFSRRSGTMRRNPERAVHEFPWGENSLRTAVEPITAQVLGLSG